MFVLISVFTFSCNEEQELSDTFPTIEEQLNFTFPVNVLMNNERIGVNNYFEFFSIVNSKEYIDQLVDYKDVSTSRVQSPCNGGAYSNVECHQFIQPEGSVCACWADCEGGGRDVVWFGSCNGPS